MVDKQAFYDFINEGNKTNGDSITLGAAMLDGETITNALVKIPLKTHNRYGLIVGANGTGKTKTLKLQKEKSLEGLHQNPFVKILSSPTVIVVF